MENVYLILDNVRSAYNVGSILRTADCAGIHKVFLCGCTPLPIDRFGRKRKDIAKVALGAEESLEIEYEEESVTLIKRLHEEGIAVVGIEQDVSSIPYTSYSVSQKTALILGEETKGLTQEVRDLCDALIEIPMHGKKESLNVSVTAGIVLFELAKQGA